MSDFGVSELRAKLKTAEAQRDEALKVVVAAKRYVDELTAGGYRRSSTTMLSNLASLRKALASLDALTTQEDQG